MVTERSLQLKKHIYVYDLCMALRSTLQIQKTRANKEFLQGVQNTTKLSRGWTSMMFDNEFIMFISECVIPILLEILLYTHECKLTNYLLLCSSVLDVSPKCLLFCSFVAMDSWQCFCIRMCFLYFQHVSLCLVGVVKWLNMLLNLLVF